MGRKRQPQGTTDISDAIDMGAETLLIAAAHTVDIAHQGPSLRLLEIVETNAPVKRQILLGRVQHLKEMASNPEAGKPPQPVLKFIQGREEVADENNAGVERQCSVGRQQVGGFTLFDELIANPRQAHLTSSWSPLDGAEREVVAQVQTHVTEEAVQHA